MHFKMSSAICFNLNQSKILSSCNGLSCCKLIKSKQHINSTIHRTSFSITTLSPGFPCALGMLSYALQRLLHYLPLDGMVKCSKNMTCARQWRLLTKLKLLTDKVIMVFSASRHLFPVFLTPVQLQLFSFITNDYLSLMQHIWRTIPV